MAETSSSPSTADTHLVVLIHGFWGNPTHLNHLREVLLSTHQQAGLEILIAKSNRDNHTYDGIEVGAERITHEIHEEIERLKKDGSEVRKFSIVGYSLGGLIARYVVGLLYADKAFDGGIEPFNFATFASPHLGIRVPKRGYPADTWNWLGSSLLSSSGQQLYLEDKFRDTGRPLLDILADPSSTFIKGLKLFKNRSAYANIQHDPAVPFYSAAISKHDPYIDLDAVDLHYLNDTDEQTQQILLDPENPVTLKTVDADAPNQQQTWLQSITPSQRTRDSLPFYAFAATLAPLGVPIFLANAGYQTYQSAIRVKSHETGGSIDLQRYRPSIFEETQKAQDALVETVANGGGEEFLTTSEAQQVAENDGTWPVLAMTPEQFNIVKNLDAVGIQKYHCHIRARRAHAAIVVRRASPSLAEGKVVCDHWARNFET